MRVAEAATVDRQSHTLQKSIASSLSAGVAYGSFIKSNNNSNRERGRERQREAGASALPMERISATFIRMCRCSLSVSIDSKSPALHSPSSAAPAPASASFSLLRVACPFSESLPPPINERTDHGVGAKHMAPADDGIGDERGSVDGSSRLLPTHT